MKVEWFIQNNNTILGPLNNGEILALSKKDKIDNRSLVWSSHYIDWIPALTWKNIYAPKLVAAMEAVNQLWDLRMDSNQTSQLSFDDVVNFASQIRTWDSLHVRVHGSSNEFSSINAFDFFVSAILFKKRQYKRVPISGTARLRTPHTKTEWVVSLRNIGHGGLGLAFVRDQVALQQQVEIEIRSPFFSHTVDVEGLVVHISEFTNLIGIQFTDVTPAVDSEIRRYLTTFKMT